MTNNMTAAASDTAVYQFSGRDAAWAFMYGCDAAGISAGYPGLKTYTVEVGIRTWVDREVTDKLASGAPVIGYRFGGGK